MPLTKILEKAQKLEIQAYRKPRATETLHETHVAFSGSPYKHPYDPDKVILLNDPFSTSTFYYEFRARDISYIEELPNIVTHDGKVFNIIRVWIKKSSIAVRCTPFRVESILNS